MDVLINLFSCFWQSQLSIIYLYFYFYLFRVSVSLIKRESESEFSKHTHTLVWRMEYMVGMGCLSLCPAGTCVMGYSLPTVHLGVVCGVLVVWPNHGCICAVHRLRYWHDQGECSTQYDLPLRKRYRRTLPYPTMYKIKRGVGANQGV